ncbi:MAG: HAD-IA family hydrolase [Candidatus Lambdaproteobacteria bacterium]|nr:HAD-IA family hydrolase [Candidatus Lambdaproteobacteria bacterium]
MANALPSPRGLVFDLDGTLVDTLPDLATGVNLTRQSYGMAPLPNADIYLAIGDGAAVLVAQTVPRPDDQRDEAYRRFLAFYNQHLLDSSRLHAGVEAVLRHYGDRVLGVVTNKPQLETERILAGLGIAGCFKLVLGGDALPRKKPDPLPLTHFLVRFGLAPREAVMIGDGYHDIRAGKAAGTMTVAVTTGVQRRPALAAEHPDHIIDRMDQLFELFA